MDARKGRLVELLDVRHVKIAYSKDAYCGHPRAGAVYSFGNGELAVIYNRAPCAYQRREDVGHDFCYFERSVQVLTRSLDNGETWSSDGEPIVWERGASIGELRARLWPEDASREELDMSQSGACFFFGRTWAGRVIDRDRRGDRVPLHVSFSLRSVDKGKTWERVPTLFAPPAHQHSLISYADPPVRLADGSFLVVLTAGGGADPSIHKGPVLYVSDDNGLSWEFIAPVAHDPTGVWGYTYPGLIMLPSGRLQCYAMRQNVNSGQGNWACMNYSDDGGLSWSEMRPIGQLGSSPWVARRKPGHYSRPQTVWDPAGRPMQTHEPRPTGAAICRSPYPLLLRDGRIVVLYGRRKPPYGMGGLVSEDEGKTWSQEFVLRDDANCGDLGYPVTTELDDGRIFTAYYYNLDDGNGVGGTRFIAGSSFRLG
jgi:hypothetical protein